MKEIRRRREESLRMISTLLYHLHVESKEEKRGARLVSGRIKRKRLPREGMNTKSIKMSPKVEANHLRGEGSSVYGSRKSCLRLEAMQEQLDLTS